MAKGKLADQFSQLAYARVTQSAANTDTSTKFNFAVPLYEQYALIIHQIEYKPDLATWDLLANTSDEITFAICRASAVTNYRHDDPRVVTYDTIGLMDFGTAGNSVVWNNTIIRAYTDLPGGGLLVPADQLYAHLSSVSLASAGVCDFTIRYTMIKLSQSQLLELIQTFQITA